MKKDALLGGKCFTAVEQAEHDQGQGAQELHSICRTEPGVPRIRSRLGQWSGGRHHSLWFWKPCMFLPRRSAFFWTRHLSGSLCLQMFKLKGWDQVFPQRASLPQLAVKVVKLQAQRSFPIMRPLPVEASTTSPCFACLGLGAHREPTRTWRLAHTAFTRSDKGLSLWSWIFLWVFRMILS